MPYDPASRTVETATGSSPAIHRVPNGSADPTASVAASGQQGIDGLLWGTRWSAGSITYSDPDSVADYQAGHPEALTDFHRMTASQMAAVAFALDADRPGQKAGAAGFSVEGFTNLGVAYAGPGSGSGTLRLANTSDPRTAYAYYPTDKAYGGDSFFGPSGRAPVAGNYHWTVILHELGHALGLKHGQEATRYGAMPAHVDSMEYSLMTYRSFIGAPLDGYANEAFGFAQTYMIYDIAALQHLYGADHTTNGGNTTYRWTPLSGTTAVDGQTAIAPGGNRIFLTVWDGGGEDTYDLSAYSTDLAVDLTPGGYSVFSAAQLADLAGDGTKMARGNVFNALLFHGDPRSLIENVEAGSGNDTITGNQADNILAGHGGDDEIHGGLGDDRLDGGAGLDRLSGGKGDDTFVVTSVADLIVEEVHGGLDTVSSTVTQTLRANVENLELTGSAAARGTGNGLANRITGNSAANILVGNDGNDMLSGGAGHDTLSGGAGADRLEGGPGDDIYMLADARDILVEETGGGTDTVSSFVTLALPAEIENLMLTGTVAVGGTGNGLANRIMGNARNNVLAGGAGHDTLEGGPGADRLAGGAGNDAFQFAAAGAGGDTILDFHNLAGDNDLLRISAVGFGGGLTAGAALSASRFLARPDNLAQEADDRFVLRSIDTTLWFDSNGNGAGGLTLLADLDPAATMTHSDIVLV